ncbi:MAG TPA: TetR/AcrR family transcriptional regulator [Actinomycetota bacterium]|nr:TetR/AcrR family transcriptional regulator [Actinomycetota bacterium]
MRKRTAGRLTPRDWAEAALEALARGGVEAVAVEPIAAALGATKGSFYWHFANRESLVEAALDLWEQSRTDDVIRQLEGIPDPAERLRVLIGTGIELGPTDRVEIALLANPGYPPALRRMRRVAQRRIGYLADQLQALGWTPAEARDRAVLIAYLYVGNMQLAHLAPRLVDARAHRRQAEIVYDALIAAPRDEHAAARRSGARPTGARARSARSRRA